MFLRVQGTSEVPDRDSEGKQIGTIERNDGATAYFSPEHPISMEDIIKKTQSLIQILGLKSDKEVVISVVTQTVHSVINGVGITKESVDRYTIPPYTSVSEKSLGAPEHVQKITETNYLAS